MKNRSKIRIVASPVQAMEKLKRAAVPVYACRKDGAYFTFEVNDNYIKKVFAIFSYPCYNIDIEWKSPLRRLISAVFKRPCLVAGAAVFAALAVLSDCLLLKVCVTGSGSYLKPEVLSIAYSCGVKKFTFYGGTDEPMLRSRVMALPCVTFCSVYKSGSVLYIDVQVQQESAQAADYSSLYADAGGSVVKIAAVCGTPLVSEGDEVAKGDALIGAYYYSGSDKIACMAVGYAEIAVSLSISVFSGSESNEARESALSAAMLYTGEEEIISRSISARNVADGVIYTVDFTYLHKISINFN